MVTSNRVDPARGNGLATFFMGFVPGLLQWQVGQKQRAAMALISCTAVYFVGWLVVGERLFYWGLTAPDGASAFDQLSRLGLPTLPEVLNMPANAIGSLLAYDGTPTGLRLMRMPRDLEHLFGWITGASGMLAAFWAAAGHWELRLRRDARADADGALPQPRANPALCAALSWLVPGLGHAKAGQKDKGVVMAIAVVLVFAMGLLFSGGHAVDRAQYGVWWIGQNLFGGGSLFAALVTGPMRSVEAPIDLDLGIVLCTVAGLMNLVIMCDAYTVAERTVFALPESTEGATSGEATA
ncbi:MAG: hypothetical protein KAI24_18750 [Planctomycetes bacterium]|nr:hypothetical protein [Planctomycetota bacterium]